MSDINLRQLSKDYFSGRLQGEDPVTGKLLTEGCGCGCNGAPGGCGGRGGPKMVEPEIMGMGPAGYSQGATSHDDVLDDSTIQDLNQVASTMYDDGEGPLAGVVSALAAMLQSGETDPTHLRQVWDTLFDIAQSGAGNEY